MPDSKPTVFVVDDDASVRQSLELLIGSAGWEPQTFASAREFLSSPPAAAPSCLVLDVNLPDLNGLEVLARLRQERPALPVIVMTAHGSEAIAEMALASGATRYLIKPVARQDLLNAVRESIGGPWH